MTGFAQERSESVIEEIEEMRGKFQSAGIRKHLTRATLGSLAFRATKMPKRMNKTRGMRSWSGDTWRRTRSCDAYRAWASAFPDNLRDGDGPTMMASE